jgi:hypothetical protein
MRYKRQREIRILTMSNVAAMVKAAMEAIGGFVAAGRVLTDLTITRGVEQNVFTVSLPSGEAPVWYMVFWNGIRYKEGLDYVRDGNTITFLLQTPEPGAVMSAVGY